MMNSTSTRGRSAATSAELEPLAAYRLEVGHPAILTPEEERRASCA